MAKILIVEDEKILNEAYQTILKKEGYDVASAFDGEEALSVADEFHPDVILLDLRMPKMDGVGFLKHYKAPTEHPDVKVIVFSNFDMQKEVEEAYALGAQRYVLKAWASPKDLVHMIDGALSDEDDA